MQSKASLQPDIKLKRQPEAQIKNELARTGHLHGDREGCVHESETAR